MGCVCMCVCVLAHGNIDGVLVCACVCMAIRTRLLKPDLCLQCACASRHTGACTSVRCKCLQMVEIVENLSV
jgi:hypothetical protein